ncbi:MAG: hypothetical protein UH625_09260 [Muribaculaceae bacterium]|nr:hypothetical protein [Muribaculaceae bacterium]
MSCQTVPGIKRIQIVRCGDLPAGLMLHAICGCIVALAVPSEDIEFTGRPTLQWEGGRVNGTNQEKSKLEFTTIHPLPEGERLAFVVTGADGRQYLIGTKEGRYPKIDYSESTGEPGKSASVRSYKISHIGQKSVLPCVL